VHKKNNIHKPFHFTIVGGNDFKEAYILCSISNIEEANI
jgi:hypothetical protein